MGSFVILSMATHQAIVNLNRRNSVRLLALALMAAETVLAQFAQSAPKLVGSGAVGGAEQGRSVAISGDERWRATPIDVTPGAGQVD